MLLLLVLLAAPPVTRHLDSKDLKSLTDVGGPDEEQSFETRAMGPGPVWFVPEAGGMLTVSFFEGGTRVATFAIGTPGDKVTAVAFDDLDHDGFAEALVMTGNAFFAFKRSSGFHRAKGIEARVRRELGDGATLPKARALFRRPTGTRPGLPRGLEPACVVEELPVAVSSDGRAAVWLGQPVVVRDLDTGQAPAWLTPRVQEALDQRLTPGCKLTQSDEPHGTGLDCMDPIDSLNLMFTASNPPIVFESLEAHLTTEGVTRTTVKIPQAKLELPIRALACDDGEQPHVLGVLLSPHHALVVSEPADSGPYALYACTEEGDENQASCEYGGGTCIHDVNCVPEPQPPQRMRVLTVPLR